jgi:hypothetical protein
MLPTCFTLHVSIPALLSTTLSCYISSKPQLMEENSKAKREPSASPHYPKPTPPKQKEQQKSAKL